MWENRLQPLEVAQPHPHEYHVEPSSQAHMPYPACLTTVCWSGGRGRAPGSSRSWVTSKQGQEGCTRRRGS